MQPLQRKYCESVTLNSLYITQRHLFLLRKCKLRRKGNSSHKGMTKVCPPIHLISKSCCMLIHLIANLLASIVVTQHLKATNWYECLTLRSEERRVGKRL